MKKKFLKKESPGPWPLVIIKSVKVRDHDRRTREANREKERGYTQNSRIRM